MKQNKGDWRHICTWWLGADLVKSLGDIPPPKFTIVTRSQETPLKTPAAESLCPEISPEVPSSPFALATLGAPVHHPLFCFGVWLFVFICFLRPAVGIVVHFVFSLQPLLFLLMLLPSGRDVIVLSVLETQPNSITNVGLSTLPLINKPDFRPWHK